MATTATLRLCLLLASLHGTAQQTNYALRQPAYQYDKWRDCDVPTNAVDGDRNQDHSTCHCSNSGGTSVLAGYPWLVVKLQKWIQVTAITFYGTSVTRSGYLYNYLGGAFWNDSLPAIVPAAGLSADPLVALNFSLLYQQTQAMTAFPSVVGTFNVTSAVPTRYLAVQSTSATGQLGGVVTCELEVYGKPSLLSGSSSTLVISDYSPYYLSNASLLTDDRDETCLSFFGTTSAQVVALRSPLSTAAKLSVLVLLKGSVRVDTSSAASCDPNLSLRVTMRRAPLDDYVCGLAATRTYLTSTLFTFTCNCTDCMSDVSLLFQKSGLSTAATVEVCEMMVFPA